MTNDQVISAYRAAGQEQVFAHWAALSAPERAGLAAEAAEIDLTEVDRLNRTLAAM